jgi:type II secretory pathway component PulK
MKLPCVAGRWGSRSRRGAALVGVLVALALVTVLMATVGWHMVANRRLAEHRQQQLQADWLARAGIEMAVARLLSDPGGYRGETLEPVSRSQVRITVEGERGGANRFRLVSEARYPTGDRYRVVVRSLSCRVRRVTDGDRVRIEVVPAREPDQSR